MKIHFGQRVLFMVSIITISMTFASENGNNSELIAEARTLFYASVEDENQIRPAIKLFRKIEKKDSSLAGRSLTYIGALTALRGKHAFLPHNKLKWVKRGLALMDEGIQKSPEDIEALFIHGSTCFHLPFFFERGDDAQEKLKRIVALLPSEKENYDAQLLKNTIEFIEKNAELTEAEKDSLRNVKTEISISESDSSGTGSVQ